MPNTDRLKADRPNGAKNDDYRVSEKIKKKDLTPLTCY